MELTGWVIISNDLKYSRSEVEALRVDKLWREVDARPIFELDCFKES